MCTGHSCARGVFRLSSITWKNQAVVSDGKFPGSSAWEEGSEVRALLASGNASSRNPASLLPLLEKLGEGDKMSHVQRRQCFWEKLVIT